MNKRNRLRGRFLIYGFVLFGFAADVCSQEKTSPELETYLTEAQKAEEETDAMAACVAYEKAIDFCRENSDENKRLASLLFRYGSVLYYAGKYNKAITALEEALEINEKDEEKDSLLSARIYMQFGLLHFFQEHWDEALYFYKKAEEGAQQIGNQQGLAIASNNIANVYQKKKDYKKAILGYEKCLELQKKLKDTATVCNTLFNMGTCYEELDNSQKAMSYFSNSYDLASAINDAEIVPLSLMHQAGLLTQKAEYTKAHQLLEQAEKKVKETGYRQVLVEIYKTKTAFYEQKKEYQSALNSYKQYQSLSDSILNEKLRVKTKSLELKLKDQEKEQEIIRQQNEIASQNRLLWVLSVCSVFGLMLTATIYWLWTDRSKKNQTLVQLNNTKDKLFHIISHDLMAPTIGQKKAIEYLITHIDSSEDQTLIKYCNLLYKNTENQLEIVTDLINWAKIHTRTIKSDPYQLDVIPIIQKEIDRYQIPAQQKEIRLYANLQKSCKVFIDKDMLAIVVRNLINNAIKFTQVGGEVYVSCTEHKDMIKIEVRDNGVGMSKEQIQAFYTTTEQMKVNFGTKGERGTGLGLILCQELLGYSDSQLTIVSEKNKGTGIQFTLNKIGKNGAR